MLQSVPPLPAPPHWFRIGGWPSVSWHRFCVSWEMASSVTLRRVIFFLIADRWGPCQLSLAEVGRTDLGAYKAEKGACLHMRQGSAAAGFPVESTVQSSPVQYSTVLQSVSSTAPRSQVGLDPSGFRWWLLCIGVPSWPSLRNVGLGSRLRSRLTLPDIELPAPLPRNLSEACHSGV